MHKKISHRITMLRLQKGVSEYQMSLELGKNRSYIQSISSGKALPSMAMFLEICEYFNITPSEFFDFEVDDPHKIKRFYDLLKDFDAQELDAVYNMLYVFAENKGK
ncbi:MAG: helix-turn-helix transcriptional regulator [Clostridiales bacterium]|nr:helix-turn-helix transcriptional regulator [Clostridiales bacterium]